MSKEVDQHFKVIESRLAKLEKPVTKTSKL